MRFKEIELKFVVYELLDLKGNCLYIGQSRNFNKRIIQHNKSGLTNQCNLIRVHVMACYPDCAFLEAQLIAIYKPQFNKKIMGLTESNYSIEPVYTVYYNLNGDRVNL